MRTLVLGLLLATACAGDPEPLPELQGSPLPDRVTGLVGDVRFEEDEVVAFTVQVDSVSYLVWIDPELDYGFDLRHLEEHSRLSDPVVVDIEQRGRDIYALSIVDA